jgi:hypothetical protein
MRRGAILAAVLAVAGCVAAGPDPARGPAPQGLFLDGAGIQPAGSPLRVDFGRAEAGTVAAVTKLLGAPPAETVAIAECAGGPITEARWANGLALGFRRGAFVGWHSAEGRGRPAGTYAGLVPGAPLPAGAAPRQTPAGPGVDLGGGVYGLAGDDGALAVIAAGETCAYRIP